MKRTLLICLINFTLFWTNMIAQECNSELDCIGFFFTEVEGNIGDVVCTEQYVCNFTNILAFQFAIKYDNTVLSFVECKSGALESYNCDGILNKSEEGIISTLWFDQNAKIVTLEAGTIMSTLCFEIIGIPSDDSPLIELSADTEPEITIGDPDDPTSAVSSTNICSGGGPAMSASCASMDSIALVDLYNATEGDNWLIRWSLENPIGTWYGVRTNERNEVMEIDLQNNNLKGELPSSMANLCQVEKIDLSRNRLTGSYPQEFEALCNVADVDFSSNELGSFESFCGGLTSSTYDLSEAGIEIFPNPVEDILSLNLNGNRALSSLRIFNVSGLKMVQLDQIKNETVIDISALNSGIFFVNILSENGESYFSKLIKK